MAWRPEMAKDRVVLEDERKSQGDDLELALKIMRRAGWAYNAGLLAFFNWDHLSLNTRSMDACKNRRRWDRDRGNAHRGDVDCREWALDILRSQARGSKETHHSRSTR